MRNQVFSLLTFLLCLSSPIYSQLTPVRNAPSPEISSLGTFGEIPVGMFTGQPDISIPLYELKLGPITLPVTISYSLASVKPESQGSSMRLGWNLCCGGYITRTVRGVKDERMGTDNIAHGLYGNAEKLRNITESSFTQHTENMTGLNAGTEWYELSADEFAFDFCGYRGNFYYTENGWQVVSDDKIKVEFSDIDGFISYKDTRIFKDFNGYDWPFQGDDNRFFNKFTLVTPDGTRYEFGGTYATEYCISYYNRNNSELIPTSWKLNKITAIDNRTAEFVYDTELLSTSPKYDPKSEFLIDLRYCPQKATLHNNYAYLNNGRAGYIGFIHFPSHVRKIKTNDACMEFFYKRDSDYEHNFFDGALYWNDTKDTDRKDPFSISQESTASQFMTFISRDPKLTEIKNIRNNLYHKLLMGIQISHNKYNKSIYFTYETDSGREKLNSIVFRKFGINQDAIKGGYIPAHDEQEEDYSLPEYYFEYDKNTMGYNYVLTDCDSWGYNNGKTIKIAETPSFTLSPPVLRSTIAETLKAITYPTGGKSIFEYELHDYSYQVSADHTRVEKRRGTSGGLRLKSIINLDSDGAFIGEKRYSYKDDYKSTSSSGISKGPLTFSVDYNIPSLGLSLTLQSKGGFSSQSTAMNSPYVGYTSVIEEDVDSLGNSLGYVKYTFSNFGTDINGESHLDVTAWGTNVIANKTYSCLPYTSKSVERGKLLSEDTYDASGRKVKEVRYKYTKTQEKDLTAATQQSLIMYRSATNVVVGLLGWLTHTPAYSYLCSSITTTDIYNDNSKFITEKKISYNSHHLLSKETSYNTGNLADKEVKEYRYVCDEPNLEYFSIHHILTLPREERISSKRYSKKSFYDYLLNAYKVPYISRYSNTVNEGAPKIEYEVTIVDKYGNPIEYWRHGVPYIQIYDNKGVNIITYAENLQLSQLSYIAGEDKVASFLSNNDYESLALLLYKNRSQMPSAHFSFYRYNDDNLLNMEITPDNLKYYFDHDSSNRLTEKNLIRDDGTWQLLKVYEYNYAH